MKQPMKNFKLLLLTLSLLSLPLGHVFAATEAQQETQSEAHEGKAEEHKPVLFPKKQADRSKATRPGMVDYLEPKALSKVSGGQVTLKWSASTGADQYRLQVATDPNFKWLVTNENEVKGTSFDLKGLETGKHYFWRVYGVKSDNDNGWTNSFANFSSFEAQ